MNDRRRGLGRGLGALLPAGPLVAPTDRAARDAMVASPVDVFFAEHADDLRSREPDVSRETPSGTVELLDRVDGDSAGAATGTLDVPTSQGGSAPGDVYFAEIPIDQVLPNPRQPREAFDEDELHELAASIVEVGLLQPVVVRPSTQGTFELVMGERRWRAAQEAGLTHLPALVRATEDADLLRDALLENLHRSQLNPLEEAAAYGQLLEDFGCTHEELARRLGRSRPQISNTLRLLKLPALVQRRVAAGVLTAGHARALLSLDDGARQERLAQRIVAEGLSVRTVEELVALGDNDTPPTRAQRAPRDVDPGVTVMADRLADRLETRVKVDMGRTRGKIVVEFASVEDLQRIVGLISPDRAGLGADG